MSGGQDSTICLYWALKNFKKVSAISFNYGQKHDVEVKIAKKICDLNNVTHKIVDISFLENLVVSNLFKGTENVNLPHSQKEDVPSSFVPYRNLIFLTLASAWASTIGANHLVIGVCQTDYSGYADCRDVFIKSAQKTLNLAMDFMDKNVVIHTPLMFLTKAEGFKLAKELGCFDIVINETLSCYNGVQNMQFYGKGCGVCAACKLRKKGYEEYREKYMREKL